MRLLIPLLLLLLIGRVGGACPVCRPQVEAGIHNANYPTTLGLVLLPVALLLTLGLGLFYWDKLSARFSHAPLP